MTTPQNEPGVNVNDDATQPPATPAPAQSAARTPAPARYSDDTTSSYSLSGHDVDEIQAQTEDDSPREQRFWAVMAVVVGFVVAVVTIMMLALMIS